MKNFIILVIFTLMVASCSKDDTTPEDQLQLISIVSADSDNEQFNVELLAQEALFEGYNKLYFKITDLSDDSKLSNATVTLKPMMHMTTMSHSAPVENPASTAVDGYFEGAVVFIMPSNPDEGWTLDVMVNTDGIDDMVTLTIPEVLNLDEARKINVISAIDGTKYFISLPEPSAPIVGINDIEFTAHYKESMMSFPAAEDLTITFEPEMPSMDHGSPNNVMPVHTAMGHYAGKVNFTMTGWWRLNLIIKKGNEIVADDVYFDVTF